MPDTQTSELISQNPQALILLVILQNVLFFAVTVGIFWAGTFVLRAVRGKGASGYGLSPLGLKKPRGGYAVWIAVGVAVGFGALILSAILNFVSMTVLERLGYPSQNTAQQPLMNGISNWVSESPAVAIPLAVFAIVLFGPAVEELVFRGAIFGGLHRLFKKAAERGMRRRAAAQSEPAPPSKAPGRIGFALSALLSSALFSLLHFSPVLVAALLVLAVVLCELFRRSGSLLPSFVAHATFNSFTVLALILAGLDIIQAPV